MAYPLYCLPTDILSYAATWSAPAGTIDSTFPLTNQNSVYSDLVTKFTGSTGTLRGTVSSTAIQAIALVNVSQSLAGTTATVTNNNSLPSTSLTIPAASPDAVSLNGWVDLRAVTTAATQWNVALSGSSAVGVGKVLLIATLRELPFSWRQRFKEIKPTNVFRSYYGVARGSRKNVRYRELAMQFMKESVRANYTALRRASEGPTQPFIIIPDPAVNDCLYCWFSTDNWEAERIVPLATSWTDTVEEQNPGLSF